MPQPYFVIFLQVLQLLLFITHLSKSAQEYSFDKIQGSVGVQGMTDAMWMLDRGERFCN